MELLSYGLFIVHFMEIVRIVLKNNKTRAVFNRNGRKGIRRFTYYPVHILFLA